jgi:hypothetical protein
MSEISSATSLEPQIRGLAVAHRNVVLVILVGLVANFAMRGIPPVLVLPLALCVAAFQLYNVYQLAKYSGSTQAWLWLVAMFVPLVNLICLLILLRKSSRILRENGVKVGLLGAKV